MREAVGSAYQLLGEAGLADTGLTGDEDQPTAPDEGVAQHAVELGERLLATNQWGGLRHHGTSLS